MIWVCACTVFLLIRLLCSAPRKEKILRCTRTRRCQLSVGCFSPPWPGAETGLLQARFFMNCHKGWGLAVFYLWPLPNFHQVPRFGIWGIEYPRLWEIQQHPQANASQLPATSIYPLPWFPIATRDSLVINHINPGELLSFVSLQIGYPVYKWLN